MTQRILSTGAKLAALTLAAAGAAALAGCEEHGYPSASPTAAPAQGEASLAGAPTTRTPEYVPPQGAPYGQPGYGPPPGAYGPPPAAYPPRYGPPAGPPEVITMAPIPNPPEHPHGWWRHEHHGWRRHAWAPAYAPPAYAPYHHPHRYWHAAPVYAAPVVHHLHHHMTHAAPIAPAHVAAPVHHVPVHHAVPPAPSHATPVAPGAQLPKPAAPDHHKHHHDAAAAAAAGTAATAAAASGGSTQTGDNNTTANATDNGVATESEADRYQALEQALKDVFGNSAELKAPAHMDANQQATVTLTLPADFAQMVRAEAAKQDLSEAAMTVNLIGSLTGDGYTIVPDQPQNMPLTLDTPTTFAWKVTPTGAGRAALKASVKAQMVGDGHELDLGSKSTGSGAATGRVVGIGLLALIALVLLGWAAQRRRPAPSGAVKPRVANFDNNPPKP